MKYKTLRYLIGGLVLCLLAISSPQQAANVESISFTLNTYLAQTTCTFSRNNFTVELPDVETKSLNSNPVDGLTSFDIAVECPVGGGYVNVIVTPSGQAVENGNTNLFLNTGSAMNVGLQLQDDSGNVITPDGNFSVTFSSSELGKTYTFTAGYAGTGNGRVSGGSFLSTVMFTLSYS